MNLSAILHVFIAVIAAIALEQLRRARRLSSVQLPATYKGKTVWVTGASSGIGKALANDLYKAGAQLVISSRKAEDLAEVVKELKSRSANSCLDPIVVPFDVAAAATDAQECKRVVDAVLQKTPNRRIDVLIHNAGCSLRADARSTLYSVDQDIFNLNTMGPIALTKLVLPHMEQGGRIVVVSSVQALLSLPMRAAYSASKHAVHAYFKALGHELAVSPDLLPANKFPSSSSSSAPSSSVFSPITVTIACPGYVRTNLSLNALCADGSKHNVMDATTASGYAPEHVSHLILQAAALRDAEVWIAPMKERLAMTLANVVPGFIQQQIHSRMIKQLMAEVKASK